MDDGQSNPPFYQNTPEKHNILEFQFPSAYAIDPLTESLYCK